MPELTGIRLRDTMLGVGRKEVKKVTTTSQLGYYEEFIVDAKNVVKANDIVVATQFAQDVNLLLQLGNVLGVVPEHDALAGKLFSLPRSPAATVGRPAGIVALGLTTGRNADLTVGTLTNDQVAVQEVGRSTLLLVGIVRTGRRWRFVRNGRWRKGRLHLVIGRRGCRSRSPGSKVTLGRRKVLLTCTLLHSHGRWCQGL